VLAGLAVFAFEARAANDKSKELYNLAAAAIYQSASQIFICLSNGKKKDLQSTKLGTDALKQLELANERLADLKGWDNEKFEISDSGTSALVKMVSAELGVPPEEFKSVHVRTFAIRAVDEMAKLIGGWTDCSAPFKTNADYIRFIGAKVKLERATQLSEIAYVPKR
jgi:hypothetical protein